MASGATVYTFDIDLADADREVYETLALRVARHPWANGSIAPKRWTSTRSTRP